MPTQREAILAALPAKVLQGEVLLNCVLTDDLLTLRLGKLEALVQSFFRYAQDT